MWGHWWDVGCGTSILEVAGVVSVQIQVVVVSCGVVYHAALWRIWGQRLL